MKFLQIILFMSAMLVARSAAGELKPNEIALVVNSAVPQSLELAEFYAHARGVPIDHIIELKLPQSEQMPFEQYDRDVVTPVRHYLRDHGLKDQVRCLVTFHGVPLRITKRDNTLLENAETLRLKDQLNRVAGRLEQWVGELETRAAAIDRTFQPPSREKTMDALAARWEHAGNFIAAAAQKQTDPQEREKIVRFIAQMMDKATGAVDLPEMKPATSPAATQSQRPEIAPTTAPAAMTVEQLIERPFDAAARDELRSRARAGAGIFSYARVLQFQVEYLTEEQTTSAVDNELALLWWPPYPRKISLPNPLNPHFGDMKTPPVVMVMRLDAPTPQLVRDIITNSLATEREGLKGKMVIDARGIAMMNGGGKPDPFGVVDERLRRLATLVHARSNVAMKLDDKEPVLAGGSESDVALYCGWYSVRNYIPGMKFNRGAVGYHIASYELVGLRSEAERGWCRGLINSGVVATLGAVEEPYLHSFPAPDEFFPLLMTGKMTLAEVYWTTTPMVSWMMTCIGDPLYRPYAVNPAIKMQDLPAPLQAAVR